MTHTGRKNRLFIILLGLFLFINLAVVAVHPVGQEGERVWKVALRSLVDAARPATQHKSNRESAGSLDSGRANQRGETSIPEDNTGKTASASGELDIPAVGDSSAIRSVSDSLLPSSPGTSGSSVEKDEDQVALDTESTRSPHTEAEETALAQARETATALAAATPSPDENTTTPTALSIPTATCTPNINARTLSLATVSVKPGERFSLALFCNDVADAAGFDVALGYSSDLISMDSVQKTSLTSNYLLTRQIRQGSISASVAGGDPIGTKSGTLLTFGGVVAATVSRTILVAVTLTRAKMYDVESRALSLETREGGVLITVGEEDLQPTPTSNTQDGRDLNATTTPSQGQDAQATPTRAGSVQATPTNPGSFDDDDDGVYDPFLNPKPTSTPVSEVSVFTATPTPGQEAFTSTPAIPTPPVRTATPLSDTADEPLLKTDMNKDGYVDAQDLFLFLCEWEPKD